MTLSGSCSIYRHMSCCFDCMRFRFSVWFVIDATMAQHVFRPDEGPFRLFLCKHSQLWRMNIQTWCWLMLVKSIFFLEVLMAPYTWHTLTTLMEEHAVLFRLFGTGTAMQMLLNKFSFIFLLPSPLPSRPAT